MTLLEKLQGTFINEEYDIDVILNDETKVRLQKDEDDEIMVITFISIDSISYTFDLEDQTFEPSFEKTLKDEKMTLSQKIK